MGTPHPVVHDVVINTNGVDKLVKNLNLSKASGSGKIPSLILKTCAESIAPSLITIFRRSLETGQLPTDWQTADIASIQGDRSKAENYRPVSLTSAACKLLQHIICRHLRTLFEKHHPNLTSRNHGFRPGCSCETQLLQ